MAVWDLPCKKKTRTVSMGLLVLTGVFVLLVYNLGMVPPGAPSSTSADTNLRTVDVMQDVLDARVTEERTEDASFSKAAANSTHIDKYVSNPQCKMKTNLVFMKVHKAGSHTTACILQRFGYKHRLNFVLPKNCGSPSLGFPRSVPDSRVMKQNVGDHGYNLLVHHTVYDRVKFHKLMAPDTQFIAILRKPLSHLKSSFYYFKMGKKFGLPPNSLGRYLNNPWLYERKLRKQSSTMTKNLQSFVLGWKDRFNQDRDEVRNFISQLDSDFPLILILEYFDASLVLLRRLMCWSFYNILYDRHPRNKQKYRKVVSYTEQQLQNHRNSSWVDYQLYDHFNRSLWSKIQSAGPDFQDELEAFQQLNHNVNSYCAGKPKQKKTFPGSKWNGPVAINPLFCEALKRVRLKWDKKICHRARANSKKKKKH
ncbi:galactose-3-O-sulfotransferase 2-like [Branchiostoma floridae x Branchiostoma japonicum]